MTRRLSLSSKRTQKFYRFCSRALHAPTHQHHHLQQNPHSMASFRVRSLLSFASGERRDGRAVRVVFLSLSFSRFFYVFERRFARQRWSVSPSRAFVPGEGVRGRRTRRKRARTAGIETSRYRTTRFCASEARSTVASFRSGTRFSRPLSR